MTILDSALDFFFGAGDDSLFGGFVDFFTDDLFSFGASTAADASTSGDGFLDFFTDPSFLAAGITALPGLISVLNAPEQVDPREALDRQEALSREQIDLQREQLASRESIAREQIAAQMAAVEAQKEAATKRALAAANQMFSQATNEITRAKLDAIEGRPELIQNAANRQIEAAQRTGAAAQTGAQNLSTALQAPSLSRT
jgi:hypothetical protein